MTEDPKDNKIIYLPEEDVFEKNVRICGRGIILKRTMNHCATTSKGGIHLPPGFNGDRSFEKKCDIGEVIVVGPDVVTVNEGDIVIYVGETGQRLPDGEFPDINNPRYVRIDESTAHIVAIFDNETEESIERVKERVEKDDA